MRRLRQKIHALVGENLPLFQKEQRRVFLVLQGKMPFCKISGRQMAMHISENKGGQHMIVAIIVSVMIGAFFGMAVMACLNMSKTEKEPEKEAVEDLEGVEK